MFDPTLIDRLDSKIQTSWGCWLWTGARAGKGYGAVKVNGRNMMAHRATYLAYYGSLPQGLVLDHKCRTRLCVNPFHLDPVTQAENVARGRTGKDNNHHRAKTHCPHGHPYAGANLYVDKHGHRKCRTCNKR